MSDPRTAELAANLAAVERRIADACVGAGRDRSELTLIVVTKTFPALDVVRLADLDVTQVGENRDREASAKVAAVAAAGGPAAAGLRWHFVGQLQRNKARSVAGYADVVHSLDRVPLVRSLAAGARHAGRVLDVLLQVALERDLDTSDDSDDSAAGRGGARPEQLPALAEAVASSSGLALRGVMAVAPRAGEPERAFERLAEVSQRLRADHPDAAWVSAGMSGDLEAAVAAGATHLRVGSAVLGSRPPLG